MSADVIEMLEAARVAKDAARFTALVLLAHPDSDKAIVVCGEMSLLAPVERDDELDVCLLAQQAIREAVELRAASGENDEREPDGR